MDLWQLALLLAAGIGAGFINVLAGGGSLLTLPVMVLMGLPGPVANGTNRVGILIQNLTATATFLKRGYPDWRLGLSLAAVALPGAVLGALLGTRLGGELFERLVALIMLAILIVMMLPRRAPVAAPAEGPTRPRLVAGHLCMAVAGFWGGFIQLGIGFVLMPILHRVMGLELSRVNQHKVLIVLVYTLVALSIFAANAQVFWVVGLSLALGNGLGGWLGAHVNQTQGEKVIRPVFIAVLAVFILALLI